MPRDLFGSVSDPPVPIGTRSRYSVPISFTVHLVVLVPLIVIPLMATGALPRPDEVDIWTAPAPLPPEPPPVKREPAERPQPPANPDAAPVVAPARIEPEKPFEPVPFESSTPGNGIMDVVTSIDTVIPAPPPPPALMKPIPVGVNVRVPAKVHDVAPVYPAVARSARIEGMVIIRATIDVDGRVTEARVLRSIALLDRAALDAVRQWEYSPTLLNGVPVPVMMTVTVTFRLQ